MQEFTVVHMWAQMGILAKAVVVVLTIMSIVTLAVSVERLLAYRRATKQSLLFANAVEPLLTEGKFHEAVETAGRFLASHTAPSIRSGIAEFLEAEAMKNKGSFDVRGAMQEAVARSSERQMSSLRRGLSALATIGSTAPFVGLFGTTFGIINSFQGMSREGGGGIGAVAGGIAEALVTTAVGIGVAIVAVLLYNYFTGKVEELEVDTHESASEVVALLTREFVSRHGDASR